MYVCIHTLYILYIICNIFIHTIYNIYTQHIYAIYAFRPFLFFLFEIVRLNLLEKFEVHSAIDRSNSVCPIMFKKLRKILLKTSCRNYLQL